MTRDEKGRFVDGHEKTGGRKSKPIEERYLKIFKSSVSPEDWKAIIDRAVLDATRGDAVARKFIADYLIGTPIQRSEITGAEGGPIETKDVSDVISKLLPDAPTD